MDRRTRPPSIVALLTLAITLVLGVGASPSAGQGTDVATEAVSVDEASVALDRAEATQDDLGEQLADLEADRAELVSDLGDRDGRRQRATRDLRRARAGAESLAILAYMTADGGSTGIGTDPGANEIYADTLVHDGADARNRAAAYYRDLRRQADAAVTSTSDRLDEIDARIAALRRDFDVAVDDVRGAATALEDARAEADAEAEEAEEARQLAALPAAPSGSATPDGNGWIPIGSIPGGPTAAQWAQLRNCEASGNYQAVSSGGAYRGAYQFDLGTWRTVGGSGDPIAASPAEQDHRAQLLWQSRGDAPWPVCGRFLR